MHTLLMRHTFLILFLTGFCCAQNVRYDNSFPSITTIGAVPYLIANIPPSAPTLQVCHNPANNVPCTNYATTFNGAGVACPNGAQDTPQPSALITACQATGDARGNIGFWAAPGTYDYTVCIGSSCFGPYTVVLTLGSSVGTSGIIKVCDTSTQIGTDLGARIIACDLLLGGVYNPSVNGNAGAYNHTYTPGIIRVNTSDAGAIVTSPVFISSGHTLSLGPGIYTNALGEYKPPFLLGNNASLTCDSWNTILQNSSNAANSENVVVAEAEAYNTFGGSWFANNADIQASGITISGCHFTDSGLGQGTSLTGTVALANCQVCQVKNNWFDGIKTTAVALDGKSSTHGFFGLDNEVSGNIITGVSNAGISIIDNKNVSIHDNIFRKHAAGSAAYIDGEPNLATDWNWNINVSDNLFDCQDYPGAATGCIAVTFQTQTTNSTTFGHIVIHHNQLIGPLVFGASQIIGGFGVGNPLAHSATDVEIDNNYVFNVNSDNALGLQGVDRGWVHDNTVVCAGGNPAILIGGFVTNSVIERNRVSSPQGYCSGVNNLGREQLYTTISEVDSTDANNIFRANTGAGETLIFGTGSKIVDTQAAGGGTDGSSATIQIPTGFSVSIPGDIALTQLIAPVLNTLGPSWPPNVTCNLTNASYFWIVTAVSATGREVPSNEVSGLYGGANGCPNLGWTYVAGATSYNVYRGTVSNGEVLLNGVSIPQGTMGYHDPGGQTTGAAVPTVNSTGALQLVSLTFAKLPASLNGTMFFCSDCKNVTDDTTGTFDSVAASGGHGTNVLRENGAWRVH